jgi:hypothetical protein
VLLVFFNQGEFMKKAILFAATAAAFALSATVYATAQAKLDKDTLKDIARHRTMSVAHEAAAKCLESGKKDDVCEKELQTACKGIAIGKFCGMRHEH